MDRTPIRWDAHDVSLREPKVQAEAVHATCHALDRIVIPQDVLDPIPGMVPRSSLIVTDEPLSSETGKGTDFVVLLSGEPQGGIKFRRRSPATEFGYARPRGFQTYWRSPFAGPFWYFFNAEPTNGEKSGMSSSL